MPVVQGLKVPHACVADYCGGCNARWILIGQEVTSQCEGAILSVTLEYAAHDSTIEVAASIYINYSQRMIVRDSLF